MAEKKEPEKKPPETAEAMSPEPARAALNPKLVVERINQLTSQIVGQAETLRTQVQESEIQRSLQELRDASVLFQNMTENATASIMAADPAVSGMGYRVMNPGGPFVPRPVPAPAPKGDCGCGSGCGDECTPKCCQQLYISRLRVIDGQGILEGRLELVVAVQAGDTWGLAPGLSSFYSIVEGTEGIKLNDPIANICVPCGECKTIPLHVEVLEQSNGSLAGSVGELRLEVGTQQGVISLRCDCETTPAKVAVGLTKAKKTIGVVEVEIAARLKAGGCC